MLSARNINDLQAPPSGARGWGEGAPTPPPTLRLWWGLPFMTMQQVHLRINDAATGQPTPVRLRITDADGTYFAPYGRLTEFATGVNQDVGGNVMIGAKKWAYIDGTCEILLPPGKLHIEIAKGPEYTPIDEEITLLAGKMSLRFTIERWCDMRKLGWHSGDTRVHFMSPDAALLEGRSEDVAVVNLLAKETEERTLPNILSFSGQSFARQTPDCGVAVNTLNDWSSRGQIALLNCHRTVFPLSWRGVGSNSEWTLADWCDQCHRKKGFVVWAHPRGCSTATYDYGEPLADLILGKVDAFEIAPVDASPYSALTDYHLLCDAGLVVPLAGASTKTSNHSVLGSMRVYTYMPSDHEFTYPNWIEALRSGRSFVTNGPLLFWTIDGEVPGAKVVVSSEKKAVGVRAEAKSWTRFDHLELLWNGEIIETAAPDGRPPYCVAIEHELGTQSGGWLAVRCVTDRTRGTNDLPLAHSSAVVIRPEGTATYAEPEAVRRLVHELDRMLVHAKGVHASGRFGRLIEEARSIMAKKLSG
jgi:hypothetical protein